jgi:hypothetical protein
MCFSYLPLVLCKHTCKHAYVLLLLPLTFVHQVIDLAMEDKKDKLFDMLKKINVYDKLKSEDRELVGKPLMKRVMQVRQVSGRAKQLWQQCGSILKQRLQRPGLGQRCCSSSSS